MPFVQVSYLSPCAVLVVCTLHNTSTTVLFTPPLSVLYNSYILAPTDIHRKPSLVPWSFQLACSHVLFFSSVLVHLGLLLYVGLLYIVHIHVIGIVSHAIAPYNFAYSAVRSASAAAGTNSSWLKLPKRVQVPGSSSVAGPFSPVAFLLSSVSREVLTKSKALQSK